MRTVTVNGDALTIEDVVDVARGAATAELAPSVGARDLEKLQGAIVRSHAAGTGEPLDDAAVRAVLLLRARTLAAGYSGVRAELPARLLELLGRGLLPVIPGKGSVGASGDLAQLAHLAQPLIGEGRLRPVDRGAAGHRPSLRRAGAGHPPVPWPAGQRREPARAAGRLGADGQSPPQQARGAGRVLPALRAAGARRGQGRARL